MYLIQLQSSLSDSIKLRTQLVAGFIAAAAALPTADRLRYENGQPHHRIVLYEW
ncbi:unnamed protein product, partial [Vitis vinifera]